MSSRRSALAVGSARHVPMTSYQKTMKIRALRQDLIVTLAPREKHAGDKYLRHRRSA